MNTYKLYVESEMYDEPFVLYCMNCMKAKQGWVPYMYHIRQNTYARDLDYSRIQLTVPGVTEKIGFYMVNHFQWMD